MVDKTTGGGLRLATHEAIALCLLGHEVMAAHYSSDCDCTEEWQEQATREGRVTCCWDGISLGEVHRYIETRTVEVPSLGIIDGRETGPASWQEPTLFDWDSFEHMGPFEAWDERTVAATHKLRTASEEAQDQQAREDTRGRAARLDEFFAKYTTWGEPFQGVQRLDCDDDELEAILGWECSSCRPDVGWRKYLLVERDPISEEVTIRSECGHCGNQYEHDATTGDLVGG